MGTGPFMLTDLVDGSSRTYAKNPDYWGFDEKFPENRLPYFDKLSGLTMNETATFLAALRSGQLDYIGHIGITERIYTTEKENIERTNPEIAFYPYSIRSENALTTTSNSSPLLGPTALSVRTCKAFWPGNTRWPPLRAPGNRC